MSCRIFVPAFICLSSWFILTTTAESSKPPPPPSPPKLNLSKSRAVISDGTNTKDNNESSRTSLPPSSSSDINSQSGIFRIVENEVWDPSTNEWKGQSPRWTTTSKTLMEGSANSQHPSNHEKEIESLSPAEVPAPDGWNFRGDWKIVVNTINNSSNTTKTSAGTDAMGWEYQYQYLRPPKRRRIWLRTMIQQQQQEQEKLKAQAPLEIPSTSKSSSASSKTKATTSTKTIIPLSVRTVLQNIRDDWNFKGMGLSMYKSMVFPTSLGIAARLPLTENFDVFDRNPELPSVSTSIGFYFPWTIVGLLSCSVRVEWIKWMLRTFLWSIPQTIVWVWYRIMLPLIWTVASVLTFPFRHQIGIPTQSQLRQSKIPDYFQFANQVSKPTYNTELSERVGCSVSYRWSQSRGYEFRVSYWHSYLPTLLLYQQVIDQTHNQLNKIVSSMMAARQKAISNQEKDSKSSNGSLISPKDSPKTIDKTSKTSQSDSDSSSVSIQSPQSSSTSNVDWWQKHFARIGIGTGYPVPSPPHFSCSAQLSLSGLYWGLNRNKLIPLSKASRTKTTGSGLLGKPIVDNIQDDRKANIVTSAKAAIEDKLREQHNNSQRTTGQDSQHELQSKEDNDRQSTNIKNKLLATNGTE